MDIYIVDAFTSEPFKGNPAGVCLVDSNVSERWMQDVASELNLSETAFLYKQEEGYILRWFTPLAEVELCGHATLASAHILWEKQICPEPEIKFVTKSGILTATKDKDDIRLSFPLEPAEDCDPPRELIEGLGVPLQYVGKNRMDYLVEVENEELVRGLVPDFNLFKRVNSRGIIVTSVSGKEAFDFVSRCFYPALGVDEDPVTGSAHCCLGPYWSNKLKRNRLQAIQLSERQGILKLLVSEDRIQISGQAVTTLQGSLVCR
ncbi:PhzF family phenazine biosynthesis protein [Paenibacillus sp. J2TS4]|uniref:PhzF family phenazine biosynthesis protein n=1 Tax=Paenibacillus sp. J2TS4 TaxID=2807194 RepID=UPI001B1D010A|nr:PhzF family phenazine biosynthesis protein [Paenibacillus sp. J2TS4]GIP31826.1 phenazine biosynthesis protein [Paenibacillus sp. J2TS4]